MTNSADRDDIARSETIAKLAESRQELRCLLEPQRQGSAGFEPSAPNAPGAFPRSRTMQMLMSSRGLGAVGAIVAGLLVARPTLALRLLRMLPAGAIARTLALRAFTALRARHE
jgi:hypothetical protein